MTWLEFDEIIEMELEILEAAMRLLYGFSLIITLMFLVLFTGVSCGPQSAPTSDDEKTGSFSDDDAAREEDDDWTVDDDQLNDDDSGDDDTSSDDDATDDDDDASPDVLILDDGISGAGFVEVLAEYDLVAKIWGLETEYEGQTLDAPVVVLFDGGPQVWGMDMPEEGQQALVNHLVNGGGLMITEWVLLDIREYFQYSILSGIIPVQMGPYDIWGAMAETFTVKHPSHPIAEQLPPSFTISEISISHMTAFRGDVIILGEHAGDAIVADTTQGGRLVYCAFAGTSDGNFNSLDLWKDEMAILARNIIMWLKG